MLSPSLSAMVTAREQFPVASLPSIRATNISGGSDRSSSTTLMVRVTAVSPSPNTTSTVSAVKSAGAVYERGKILLMYLPLPHIINITIHNYVYKLFTRYTHAQESLAQQYDTVNKNKTDTLLSYG